MREVYIGTSGFSYPHWRDVFYPRALPQKDWFEYYVKYFDTVELNVSFYRLPKKETFANWRKRAGKTCLPAGKFVFAIKGSRYITHVKRLKDCQDAVKRFFENAKAIRTQNAKRKTQNAILWQLPPRMKANSERLEEFLSILPAQWRHAFEFRHESWLSKEIFEAFKEYKAAIVFQDFPDWPVTEEVTADFVYLRFHGKTHLYTSGYSKEELKKWSRKIDKWMNRGLDVYAYFNNDALGYAVENAQTLKELVAKDEKRK
jgi:uncharacterized protein YecE (DUF72 family)